MCIKHVLSVCLSLQLESKGADWFPYLDMTSSPYAGKPVAFKLIPLGGPTLLAKPYSLIAKRGLFATKNLWVTPHKEEERYAAGDWVLQAEGGDGLEEWVKQVWEIPKH